MSTFQEYFESSDKQQSIVYKIQDIKTKYFYTGIDIARWNIDKFKKDHDVNSKLYREIFQPNSGKIYLMISPIKKRIEEIKERYKIDCKLVKFKLVEI